MKRVIEGRGYHGGIITPELATSSVATMQPVTRDEVGGARVEYDRRLAASRIEYGAQIRRNNLSQFTTTMTSKDAVVGEQKKHLRMPRLRDISAEDF